MPSSMSVLVFEKQKLRYLLQSPHDPLGGCDPRGSIERLTLAGPKTKLPLDG
jgi:hypothetical protein